MTNMQNIRAGLLDPKFVPRKEEAVFNHLPTHSEVRLPDPTSVKGLAGPSTSPAGWSVPSGLRPSGDVAAKRENHIRQKLLQAGMVK